MNLAHWLTNLAGWSAQCVLLIAAGSLAGWVFRLRAPRVRLIFGQALVVLCLLLPVVEPWRASADGRIEFTSHPAQPISSHRPETHSLPWRSMLLAVLAGGCAIRLLWLAAGFGKLSRWRRNSETFTALPSSIARMRDALAPGTEFLLSASISGPVTFGFRKPVIVLPGRFGELPADLQEAVACHELLHVKRRDWVVTVAEEAIRAVFWFHPAIWWLISQVQLAREQTVDAEVVQLTRNRTQYLNALLEMAGNQPALDLAPATLFLRKRHLKNRVALLLQEVTMSKRQLLSFCATSCALLAGAGWFAMHTFPLQAAPAPQEQSDPKLLHDVAPKYPAEAREKRIEGPVVMEVQINPEGHVSDARVLSGPEELRRAAIEAVLQWHYSPKAMNLPATTQVTMNFKLSGGLTVPAAASLPEGQHFTVREIEVKGLSAAVVSDLLQRLPVRANDNIDNAGMQSLIASAHEFDDDLQVSLHIAPANQVHVAIAPSGYQEPESQGGKPLRIRVGGNVQQTKVLTKVQPVYPPEAKAARIQGVVKLEAILGKDGKVENLKLLEGDATLAAAAMEAVRQWQYQTTLLNGDPVEVVTQIDVNFTLSQ